MGPDFILTSPPTGNLSGQTQEKGKSSTIHVGFTIHVGGSVRIAIVSGTSTVCAGKVPRMRGAADGPGSQSYAGNINPFSYSARLEAIFLPPVKRFNHDISHDTSFSLILISFKLFTLSKDSSYRRV